MRSKPVTLRNQFDNLRVAEDFSTLDDHSPKDHKAAAEVEDAPSPLRKRYEATEPAAVQPNKSTTVKKLETLKALKGSSTSMFLMQFPELSRKVDAEMTNINAVLAQEGMELHLCEDESDGEEEIMATEEKVVIRAAMDSGSVASVINPEHLPSGVKIKPNTSGRHFTGAGVGSTIKKHGSCITACKGKIGMPFGCKWQAADVARPLQSVSDTCGPCNGPGVHDVLFNNRKCYVVPPGMVDEIMTRVKPIVEYDRVGGLYLADLTLSSFGRQDVDQ